MPLKITKEQRAAVRAAHTDRIDQVKAFCLLRLVRDNPKGYRNILVNNSKTFRLMKYKLLVKWIDDKTLLQSDVFAEKCYSAIYQDAGICKRGNQKHVKKFTDGFEYCSNRCECANENRKALCTASYYARMK